jgi:hypothetical protein
MHLYEVRPRRDHRGVDPPIGGTVRYDVTVREEAPNPAAESYSQP